LRDENQRRDGMQLGDETVEVFDVVQRLRRADVVQRAVFGQHVLEVGAPDEGSGAVLLRAGPQSCWLTKKAPSTQPLRNSACVKPPLIQVRAGSIASAVSLLVMASR